MREPAPTGSGPAGLCEGEWAGLVTMVILTWKLLPVSLAGCHDAEVVIMLHVV